MSGTLGRFEMSPVGPFQACTYTTIRFRYIAGSSGMDVGAKLKIGLPNMGWGEPLTPYPRQWPEVSACKEHAVWGRERVICNWKRCNTTYQIVTKGGADLYLSRRESQMTLGKHMNWSWWITATVEIEPLGPGGEIVITYGDRYLGEQGVFVQPWAEEGNVWFSAFADPFGSSRFEEVPGSPIECRVSPGPAEKCIVTVPSIVRPGKPFGLKASLTDWGEDRLEPIPGLKVEVRDPEGVLVETGGLFKRSSVGTIGDLATGASRRYACRTQLPDGRSIEGRSNPLVCKAEGPNLYWGDLHAQSFYHQYNRKLGHGDPCQRPDELLGYAREVSHLDFVAITDGEGAYPHNPGWEETQRAVSNNYVEGAFVPFKGWEIQKRHEYGHRNAIHREAVMEPHIPPETFPEQDMSGVLRYYQGRDDVILIPHHTLAWGRCNWDVFDPELDRLVEIYSCWGSSEYAGNPLWDKSALAGHGVMEALSRGHKVGFVGGSDSHIGFPGRSIHRADRYWCQGFKSGYTAVWAESLTRDALFDALRARRCYATTGARIIVEFAVDGVPMGQTQPQGPARTRHEVYLHVVGTDRIRRVEVVRDGEASHTIEPYEEDLEATWVDDSDAGRTAAYYYLRVEQADGNRAWTSPVWTAGA